jgi:hypothetical protein
MFSEIKDENVLGAALELARGSYQRNILLGHESLSGSTLRGRARNYSGRYKYSAQAVISRCQKSGLAVQECRGPHGKRIVVIG